MESRTFHVFLTGGAGFIGSHVARAYRDAGHRVTVFDDLSTGRRDRIPEGVDFVRGDLGTFDFETGLAQLRVDVVNHHAAHIDLRESVRDPVSDARTNVVGTLRLLEGCRRAGVRRVVFASTGGAIYGEPKDTRSREEDPTEPLSPYGIGKLAAEKYLGFYRTEHGFRTAILRYANVYGPGQSGSGEAGVVAIFAESMLAGRAPVVHGDGQQTRDFVYVGDCARANVAVLGHGGSGLWNVGTGAEVSVNSLYDQVARSAGFSEPTRHDDPAPGEQRRSVLDGEKIRRDLGLPDYTPLAEGLLRTVEFFRGLSSRSD